MKITLAPKHDMWFLIGTKYHLSFENRGPIDVDFESLKSDQKQQVIWSIQRGVILSDKPVETIQQVVAKSYISPAITQVLETISKQTPEELLADRTRQLQAALGKTYNTFKKELKNYSISELRSMKLIELGNKNRKSTLELLDLAISKHQAEVMKQVAKEDTGVIPDAKLGLGTGLSAGGKKVDWSNIEDVVESDLEEVEISLGAE